MISPIRDRLIHLFDNLKRLARLGDHAKIKKELKDVREEDIADAASRLEPEEAINVLRSLEPIRAANIIVEMPTESAREIVTILPDEELAYYLDILPMDDALDLREEIEPDRFESLLNLIPEEDAKEIRRLLSYPDGSVGRIMTEKFFYVSPEKTMGEILKDVRSASDEKFETLNDIYVVDDQFHLFGVIPLRSVIRHKPAEKASEVMTKNPISCPVYEPEEAAARKMSKYGFYALPVLDHQERMVGLFTGDDAQDILREYDTQDVLAVGAVSGQAEPYMSLNIFQLFKRRIPWLFVLFLAEFLTGAVLRHYGKGSADEVTTVDLMLFIPLLIGAGGNAGSQVTTTITRALALDEIRGRDTLIVLTKEVLVAMLVGGSLGMLGYIRAVIPAPFGWGTDPRLSLVVGLALPAIVMWAGMVASVLPIVAKKLGFDPAVMSAPFITTLVDATGLVIYFEIALRIIR